MLSFCYTQARGHKPMCVQFHLVFTVALGVLWRCPHSPGEGAAAQPGFCPSQPFEAKLGIQWATSWDSEHHKQCLAPRRHSVNLCQREVAEMGHECRQSNSRACTLSHLPSFPPGNPLPLSHFLLE